MYSKNALSILKVMVVLSAFASPVWAGCWACEQVGTSPVTCASKFLSGGTSCELKCSDRLGGSYCICKTSGICEGGRGCDGPCPNSEVPDGAERPGSEMRVTAIRQVLEGEREQELPTGENIARFPEPFLAELGETHPLAAALLDSFIRNGRLTPGHFNGVLSITPSDGSDGPAEVYAFEAQVTSDSVAERFSIAVRLADHPEIERITGTIRLQKGLSEVRIQGRRGDEEVFRQH